MPQLLPEGKQQYFDDNGIPLVGGQLFTYSTGTLTPLQTTSDAAGLIPNPNPIILDARGEAQIFWSGNYTVTLEDSLGNLIWTVDDVDSDAAFALDLNALGKVLFPRTAQEIAANVTPTNYGFESSPHDIRRYGFVGDGVTDDSPAWAQLALVMAQGGDGVIPPGKTYVASQVTFTVPPLHVVLYGYGVDLYTNNGTTGNAIYGLEVTGGGSLTNFKILGITYHQLDAMALGGFHLNLCNAVNLTDCAVDISSTVAAGGQFSCVTVDANHAGMGYWNRINRLQTRQDAGAIGNYAPAAITLNGAANATKIRDCVLVSVSVGIRMICDVNGIFGNSILIDGNDFEGCTTAIFVNGQDPAGTNIAASQIAGLRITNSRAESCPSGFLTFYAIQTDSVIWPTWLSGNVLVSSCPTYITCVNCLGGNGQLTVNSLDMGLIPNYPNTKNLTSSQPLIVQNNASTGGNYDAIKAVVQTAGGGIAIDNTLGVEVASLRYRVGGGAALAISGVQVMGPQVQGYGTPTGGLHHPSFAASTIALSDLAAVVAQLILDLETHGMLN